MLLVQVIYSIQVQPNQITRRNNTTLSKYLLKQIKLVLKAGLDSRKAPDSLQTPQLECTFS